MADISPVLFAASRRPTL